MHHLRHEHVPAVGDGRNQSDHLQRGRQQVTLPDRDIHGVGARPDTPQILPHPRRAGHLPGIFHQALDAGRRAEAQFQGIVRQQVGVADVHVGPGLPEVGVTGAGQRLRQIQRAVTVGVHFQDPAVAGVVPGRRAVPHPGAHILVIQVVDAAVCHRRHRDDLKDRTGRVGALGHPVDLRLAHVVLHLHQPVARVRPGRIRVKEVGVKAGVAGQRQDFTGAHVHHHGGSPARDRAPVGGVIGITERLLSGELKARVDRDIDTFAGAWLARAQRAQYVSTGGEDLQFAAGCAAQRLVPTALDARDADNGVLRHAARLQGGQHFGGGIAHIADHMRGQPAGDITPRGALLKSSITVIDQFLAFQRIGRGVDLAHQRYPVGGAAVKDILQLGFTQAQHAFE